MENTFSILINLIFIGFFIYIYKTNKYFLTVYILIILLLIFLLPDIIIPKILWQIFSNIKLFNFPIKIIKSLIILACLLIVSFSSLSSDNLDQARNFFIDGKYKNAMKEASKYNSAEAKILTI